MLSGRRAVVLGVGVVVLEFASAVTAFVTSTLLPLIVRDLEAGAEVSILVSAATVGLFVAMPLADLCIARLGSTLTLTGGLLLTCAGGAVSATADNAWVFAGGRFAAGFAGGVLAVFGVSAAVKYLDDTIRRRVIAVTASAWILPGLSGPAITVALEHLIGWRWTLLTPIPIVVVARLIIVRSVPRQSPRRTERPIVQTLLLPFGVTGFLLLAGSSWTAWIFLAIAVAGFLALMPHGTVALWRGAPASLFALTMFGLGFFGATALVTLLFTAAYGASIAAAGVALGMAPVAWALASLLQDRLEKRGLAPPPGLGVGLAALCVGALGPVGLAGGAFWVGATLWIAAGAAVGLFYPTLYLRATTPSGSLSVSRVATAAISAEAFGELFGGAVGGFLVGGVGGEGAELVVANFVPAYLFFGAMLGIGAIACWRSTKPASGPDAEATLTKARLDEVTLEVRERAREPLDPVAAYRRYLVGKRPIRCRRTLGEERRRGQKRMVAKRVCSVKPTRE